MTMTPTDQLQSWLAGQRDRIDEALDRFLPSAASPPPVIHEAMRYAVLGGGKRIRPILALAAAEAVGADTVPLLRPAASLELIHTYSLVHDDLPALDDDDLRRGRETTHVVFGEAIAILAGDALLTEAFSWLATPVAGLSSERQLQGLAIVAEAIDSRGMIGGQVADLESERMHQTDAEGDEIHRRLEFIHRNKTGRLITASAVLGGVLGGASAKQLAALRNYGEATGLAFQIVDDLLDQEGTAETLGKTAGKDLAQGKLTYPALHGTAEARHRIEELLETATESAAMITGYVNYLGPIARYLCVRKS